MAIRMTRRTTRQITRRDLAALAGGLLRSTKTVARTETALLTRPIPGSGELIPAVGLGTAYVFDQNSEATRSKADAVVQALIKNGGRLIDTASTYGDAESVLGEVTAAAGLRDKLFIATKLELPDLQELKRSLARLKTASVDLLQLHNVRSKQQSLQRFREWKKQGVCRYVGITSTFRRDYPAVEVVLEREKPDFVQIDYSLDNRDAEKTILPLAAEVKAGCGDRRALRQRQIIPGSAWQGIAGLGAGVLRTWGQFFLKYLLGDPRVTAVIPGTSDPGHMADNAGAMRGPLPDPDQRRRMVEFVEAL